MSLPGMFLLPVQLTAHLEVWDRPTSVWSVNPLYTCISIALADLEIPEEIGWMAETDLSALGWGMEQAPCCLPAVCLQQAVIPCLVAQPQLAGGWLAQNPAVLSSEESELPPGSGCSMTFVEVYGGSSVHKP